MAELSRSLSTGGRLSRHFPLSEGRAAKEAGAENDIDGGGRLVTLGARRPATTNPHFHPGVATVRAEV